MPSRRTSARDRSSPPAIAATLCHFPCAAGHGIGVGPRCPASWPVTHPPPPGPDPAQVRDGLASAAPTRRSDHGWLAYCSKGPPIGCRPGARRGGSAGTARGGLAGAGGPGRGVQGGELETGRWAAGGGRRAVGREAIHSPPIPTTAPRGGERRPARPRDPAGPASSRQPPPAETGSPAGTWALITSPHRPALRPSGQKCCEQERLRAEGAVPRSGRASSAALYMGRAATMPDCAQPGPSHAEDVARCDFCSGRQRCGSSGKTSPAGPTCGGGLADRAASSKPQLHCTSCCGPCSHCYKSHYYHHDRPRAEHHDEHALQAASCSTSPRSPRLAPYLLRANACPSEDDWIQVLTDRRQQLDEAARSAKVRLLQLSSKSHLLQPSTPGRIMCIKGFLPI